MRVLASFLALLLLAVTIPSSDAVGGVLVAGVGAGDTYRPDGQPFCRGHPVNVQAIYWPGGGAMLRVSYLPAPSCPLSNGGGYWVGYSNISPSSMPPVNFGFLCFGTESTGMYCDGTPEEDGWAQVGPYSGPGSSVSIDFCSPTRCIRGSFTAT